MAAFTIFRRLFIRNCTILYRSWIKLLIEIVTILTVFLIIIHDPLNSRIVKVPNEFYRFSEPIPTINKERQVLK